MTAFLWAIITACIWGIVPILEKTGLLKATPLAGLFYRCLGVFLGFIVLMTFLVKPAEIKAVDLKSASFLILGGFLASFVAQMTFYNALKQGEVSRIMPIAGSFPLIAFILGILILGESFSWIKMAGAMCIVTGIIALKLG
ncbi:MAG: EamA family transporter [Candidatus Aceula meridiana]|nr:EamA family transporter [Candidatus Aceula meridiana]